MNTENDDMDDDEKEAYTSDQGGTTGSPTTKPTTSSTTAKAGASMEIPSSNLDTESAEEKNDSLSVNKVSCQSL